MNKIIKFQDNFGEYQDDTPYIIAENDPLSLMFDFSGNSFKPKTLKIVYAVGPFKSKILDCSSGTCEIPYDFFDGALRALTTKELVIELHEFSVLGFEINQGRYKVEPLSVTKVHDGIESYAVIQELKKTFQKKSETFSKSLKTANDEIDALKQSLMREQNNNIALLKYIYRHYWNDLRDSEKDFPVKDFAAAIGMDVSDMSEEKLGEIEKFKTKEGVL